MSEDFAEPEEAVSSVERVLVLLAMVALYAAAAFGALFVLVLLGAPEGDSAGLLVCTVTVMVALVTALSAPSSRTAGRVAMGVALAIPAAFALYVWAGG